jgi:hypothetical protein
VPSTLGTPDLTPQMLTPSTSQHRFRRQHVADAAPHLCFLLASPLQWVILADNALKGPLPPSWSAWGSSLIGLLLNSNALTGEAVWRGAGLAVQLYSCTSFHV